MGEANDLLNNVAALQEILNMRADKVPELSMYEFEANQRVYELAVVLMLSRSINRLYSRSFIPAWQRPRQESAMKAFTSKESWDGFLYENPDNPLTPVPAVPIEIKSTMIHPTKTVVENPNQLLKDSLPKYESYFQAEGSICAVFIPPYRSGPNLRFDLKEATIEMNKLVAYGAMGALCLLSFPKDEDGKICVSLHCHFVSKDPKFADNGNIDHINLTEMHFGKFD